MSDLDTLKAMLLRAGYAEKPGAFGGSSVASEAYGNPVPPRDLGMKEFAVHRKPLPSSTDSEFDLSLELGAGPNGYDGFACSFYFDVDGNLIGHGVWE